MSSEAETIPTTVEHDSDKENKGDAQIDQENEEDAVTEDEYQSVRASLISITVKTNATDADWGIQLQAKQTQEEGKELEQEQEQETSNTQKVDDKGDCNDKDDDNNSNEDNHDDGIKTTKSNSDEKREEIVEIASLEQRGLLSHAPIQAGDVIRTINNQKCTSVGDTMQKLRKIPPDTYVTIVIETPSGNPHLIQSMITKPTPTSVVGIGFLQMKRQDQSTTTNNSKNIKYGNTNETMLHINHIFPSGLLSQSILSQGDIVLAINGVPCSSMPSKEAAELVRNAPDHVSIVVWREKVDIKKSTEDEEENLTRRQRLVRNAKRAGVAVGGGAMVGVGLVFIPTLPPPFGEVLIVGGVSLLSTEFEGPKRVMRSARDSLGKAVGPEEQQKQDLANVTTTTTESEDSFDRDNDNQINDSQVVEQDGADKEGEPQKGQTLVQDPWSSVPVQDKQNQKQQRSQPKKPTMGDRFKRFGRNVVLPFLDQVVGDKHENSPLKPDEDESKENEEKEVEATTIKCSDISKNDAVAVSN